MYVDRPPKILTSKITASTFKSLKMVLFGDLFWGGRRPRPAAYPSRPVGRPQIFSPWGRSNPKIRQKF